MISAIYGRACLVRNPPSVWMLLAILWVCAPIYLWSQTAVTTPVGYARPSVGMLQAGDGNFYAPSQPIYESCVNDTTHLCSYIYAMSPSGTPSLFHSFQPISSTPMANPTNSDGIEPTALIVGTDGSLYGACMGGGPGGFGTIFRIDLAQNFTVLKSFGITSNTLDPGAQPLSLIQGADGNFYFTNGLGVYQLTTSGDVNTVYTFPTVNSVNPNGSDPTSIVQGNDGNFYLTLRTAPQTTQGGGAQGALAKLTPGGVLTILHIFAADGSEGDQPMGPLAEGSDGSFYGLTLFSANNSTSPGTAFKAGSDGSFQVLHPFTSYAGNRDGVLTLGSDGNFYGATVEGGDTTSANCQPAGCGTLYQMTSSGMVTILHQFEGGAADPTNPPMPPTIDGASPTTPLVQTSGGSFYGTSLGNTQSQPIVDQTSLTPALPSPVQLTFDPPQVNAGNPTTLSWKVLNAFSLTAQQCGASIVGSSKGAGEWSGPQTGNMANGAYSGSAVITPTAGGTFTYALTCGGIETGFGILAVHGTDPLQITTSSLPNPTVSQPYTGILSAKGGTTPYTWKVSGKLPKGLGFDPGSGILSGTPLQFGTYSLAFAVQDSTPDPGPYNDAVAITVTVDSGLQLSASLPNPTVGVAYSQAVTATGGLPPYTWQVVSGSLPAGLTFNASAGVISGTPTAQGSSTFTIGVADSEGTKATTQTTYTLSTIPPGLSVTSPNALPSAAVGTPYSYTLAATGGTPPYMWSLSTPAPAGLSLSSGGVLSGTPTQYSLPLGSVNVLNVTVTDSSDPKISVPATLSLNVKRTLQITVTGLPNGRVGTVTNTTLTATGGIPPYTWFGFIPGQDPDKLGISLDKDVLTYNPLIAANFDLELYVQDSEQTYDSASATFPVEFLPAPVPTTTTLTSSNTAAGTGESVTFTAAVTNSGSGTPTGQVIFSNGQASLGTVVLDSTGKATLQTSFSATGTYSITAVYSGDANYAASTSTAVIENVVTPSVTAAATPVNLTVQSGASGQLVITVTPIGGYTGTINFTCGTLPANMSCTFAPATLTIDSSGGPFTDTLTVSTSASHSAMLLRPGVGGKQSDLNIAGAIGLPGMLTAIFSLFFIKQRAANPRRMSRWMFVVLLSLLVGALSSCGSSPTTARPGTYTIPISLTAAGKAITNFNVTVVVE